MRHKDSLCVKEMSGELVYNLPNQWRSIMQLIGLAKTEQFVQIVHNQATSQRSFDNTSSALSKSPWDVA